MKKLQLSLFALLAGFSLLLCQNASAANMLPIPIYSGIYNFASGQLGSVGAIDGWANNNTSIVVTNGSGSLDGTSLGLVASTGDKVYVNTAAAAATGTYMAFANKGTFPQSTNVDIYASFLYKFDSVPAIGSSQVICQEILEGSSSTIYYNLQVTNNGGQIQLGVQKDYTSGTVGPVVFAATNMVVGQTYFIVARHQILSGSSDDIIDLWINPPAGSFGASEASVPTASATTATGSDPTSGTGPGRFYFSVGPNATGEFDEFRMATNWAAVTPAFGSCISASIYQNPASQTNVAEIADTFTVIPGPLCTSPTYQWQMAPSNTTAWASINGAVAAAYTTPNLALATDNGNQYRCIVTVPCDGSSATSTVATVTLTAPVVTPVGLILNDTFTAGIAEPITPVTSTNASWYTDLATYSGAFDIVSGPPSYLLAYPQSGSSTLWLAYVTPTNIPPASNLPVDLAVGTTMAATCQFTPNSFGSFTNNGSLRFGLFDYADGGTRIVTANSTCGGSSGNGVNVRGYMLSLDFGMNFSSTTPLSLYSRVNTGDINLMGTTGDYVSLGGGPAGGGYSNAPAFQAGVNYTMVFSVSRTDVNTVIITNSITGGGTNWTVTLTETNQAYHRFDAFAIRPQSLETTADSFNISQLKIEVLSTPSAPPVPTSIALSSVSRSGGNVSLTWNPTPAGSYSYTVQRTLTLNNPSWSSLQTGITATNYTDTTATGSTGFYRVTSP